jgi:hypothetical protein
MLRNDVWSEPLVEEVISDDINAVSYSNDGESLRDSIKNMLLQQIEQF